PAAADVAVGDDRDAVAGADGADLAERLGDAVQRDAQVLAAEGAEAAGAHHRGRGADQTAPFPERGDAAGVAGPFGPDGELPDRLDHAPGVFLYPNRVAVQFEQEQRGAVRQPELRAVEVHRADRAPVQQLRGGRPDARLEHG